MNNLILKNELIRERDIRTILFNYLETVPEIQSCSLDIELDGIEMYEINNTNFRINRNIEYFVRNTSELYSTNLFEANMKKQLAIEVCLQLIKYSDLLIDLLNSRQLQDTVTVFSSPWQYIKNQEISSFNLTKDNKYESS